MAFLKVKFENSGCFTTIIFAIALFIFNIKVGAWSVAVILSWFNIAAPGVVNGLLGLFLGEFTVPAALLGKLLQFIGLF